MNIMFAGTPTFAVPCLTALLHSKHNVVGVITSPDKPAGRGQHLQESPVKQIIKQTNIPLFQPSTLKKHLCPDLFDLLSKADIMVVVAYGLLLPCSILSSPRLDCINVHASLLPRWRGASPIQAAILAGDTETGITIMQITKKLDAGPILNQARCSIQPNDNTQNIHDKLAKIGADMLLKTLETINNNQSLSNAAPQDEAHVTYAHKIKKAHAIIDWTKTAEQLERQVRAFNPWPIAYGHIPQLCDQPLRIWQATTLISSAPKTPNPPAGTIIATTNAGIDIATSKGILRLLKLQRPGGRPLPAAEFVRGLNIQTDKT